MGIPMNEVIIMFLNKGVFFKITIDLFRMHIHFYISRSFQFKKMRFKVRIICITPKPELLFCKKCLFVNITSYVFKEVVDDFYNLMYDTWIEII
jgi:hypothetical protein